MPRIATRRQRSSSTQRRSSASSSARPTKPIVSGASPQSWARSTEGGAAGAGEQCGKPLLVERSVHARRLARGGGPECACLRRLAPNNQAARLEQYPDKDLESLS